MTLPAALYRAADTREMDRRAIAELGIAGAELMVRAGRAAFELLRQRWPHAHRIAVLCGPGNNGGDGWVVARLALAAGMVARVFMPGQAGALRGDAAAARDAFLAQGGQIEAFEADALRDADVIVDALFGTGLERDLDDPWRTAVAAINAARRPVLALDLPSGLHADCGRELGVAVQASATISFIGLKAGLYTGAGPRCGGVVYWESLELPDSVQAGLSPWATRLEPARLAALAPPRARDAHKGDNGHVLVVGGQPGMSGAVRLAGEAAYRAGAGLVTVATHPEHATGANASCPELISCATGSAAALTSLWPRVDVVALGPGLGQSAWSLALWAAALEARRPLVIDADGLNLLALDPTRREDWILTPHPGEAARLLGCSVADIQHDRYAAARAIAASFGGVCVLKGVGTVVADAGGGPAAVCDRGNPGMASGGMGDVLTGVIAALMGQGLAAADAAQLGVFLHADAGDAAAQGGEIGLLARDVIGALRGARARLAAMSP